MFSFLFSASVIADTVSLGFLLHGGCVHRARKYRGVDVEAPNSAANGKGVG